MKLSEIKEQMSITTENILDKLIEVKKYKTIGEKSAICEEIVSQCLTEKDGMRTVDYAKKVLSIDLAYVIYYSDIELDIENSFDYMAENGIIGYIKFNIIPSEKTFIEELVDNMINEEKEIHNSIAGVINNQLSNLIAKIPDEKVIKSIMKDLPKAVNKIKPEYLSTIMDVFKKEKLGL